MSAPFTDKDLIWFTNLEGYEMTNESEKRVCSVYGHLPGCICEPPHNKMSNERKTAKPIVCEHGSLKRQCLPCELSEEISRLKAENEKLRNALEGKSLYGCFCEESLSEGEGKK